MRKFSLLSIFVFALSLAVVPFGTLRAQEIGSKAYFGISSGYSYQKLDLKGSLTVSGIALSDFEIKENGFFLAPKLGFLLGDSRLALEFEPRWTIGSYDTEFTASSGVSSTQLEVEGDTFHHLLLPMVIVLRSATESGEFSFGVGTGTNFYDVGDDISRTTSIPLIGKLGFAFSISEKTTIGLDGQFMYSLWENDSSVDSLWSLSIGPKLQHKF